jgi:hypothetical protein
MDEELKRAALEGEADVSRLPCHLLASYFYIRLALARLAQKREANESNAPIHLQVHRLWEAI